MKRRRPRIVSKNRPTYASPGRSGDWKASGLSGTELTTKVRSWSQSERDMILNARFTQGYADRRTSYGADPYWPLGYEGITTTVGKNKVMNNCRHLKQTMLSLPVTAYRYYSDTFHHYEMYYRWDLRKGYFKDALNTALQSELSLGDMFDQQFSARAYWSMRPKFKGDVSMLNTIFETKDFVDPLCLLGLGWLKTSELVRRYNVRKHVGRLKKLGKAVLSLPFSAAASVLSAGQLAWALAIKPTVADAISIHAALQKDIFALAKEFNELGEAGARSHYSERQEISRALTRRTGSHWGIADGSYTDVKRTATAVFYQQLLWQQFEDAYPRWWGFELGADEVWNTLPLSFLLDYVFTVGKSLEMMDRDNRVEVQVMEYCESIKIVASMGTYVIHDAYVPALAIDRIILPKSDAGRPLLVTGTAGTVYQRIVKDPYRGPALPRIKVPSFNQGLNMAALAHCLLIHDSNTGKFLAR